MVKRILASLLSVLLVASGMQNAAAANTLTLNIKKTPTLGEPKVTLYGLLKPAKSRSEEHTSELQSH